jgi:hypothetical protein
LLFLIFTGQQLQNAQIKNIDQDNTKPGNKKSQLKIMKAAL